MRLPKTQLDENLIIKLAKKFKIREVSLFGSALREDFREESDIDLLIEFEEGTDYSLFDLFSIQDEFSKQLGLRVDLVEKAGLRNPFRKETILRTARLIYAA